VIYTSKFQAYTVGVYGRRIASRCFAEQHRAVGNAFCQEQVLQCIGVVSLQTFGTSIFIGVVALPQGCCQPVLQSSIEQWKKHFAKHKVLLHWSCTIADLYEQQTFIGVIALSKGCCQPVLQSSIEQWGFLFSKKSAAVHCFCVTADLYEQQTFIGEVAFFVTADLYEQIFIGDRVRLHSHKAAVSLFCRAIENAFFQEQCCSALTLGHCRPV